MHITMGRPKDMILSEMSQSLKDKYGMIQSWIEVPGGATLRATGNKMRVF